ncbi:hypothetical protein [Mucilaginibacter agri]|uniref:Uncharacterized protein n=1 Tax=Mucilaginibacter agri TaxID=2695265 RepID=A0A965ZIV2_9SPHI|nr:hypothetical protein [Mucilaginibacter agri]NCD70501.1 hypothetical protein [Mucilaginibacter agri]
MNIDDLKDAWKEDCPGKINSLHDAISGKTSSAIQRVRRNMRNELIGTIISYAIMAGFLFRHPQVPLFFNIACIMLFALTVLLCYYFTRFYIFYKAISRYDTNLRDSAGKAAYELELNMELYKAFNLCTTPLAVAVALGIVWGKGASDFLVAIFSVGFTPLSALTTFGSILISFLATYFFINLHVNRTYGRPLKELKAIMADLQAE